MAMSEAGYTFKLQLGRAAWSRITQAQREHSAKLEVWMNKVWAQINKENDMIPTVRAERSGTFPGAISIRINGVYLSMIDLATQIKRSYRGEDTVAPFADLKAALEEVKRIQDTWYPTTMGFEGGARYSRFVHKFLAANTLHETRDVIVEHFPGVSRLEALQLVQS